MILKDAYIVKEQNVILNEKQSKFVRYFAFVYQS